MEEVSREHGDLFGALVRRKVNADSGLYNDVDLFNLSLPPLSEGMQPEIFLEEAPRVAFNSRFSMDSTAAEKSRSTVDSRIAEKSRFVVDSRLSVDRRLTPRSCADSSQEGVKPSPSHRPSAEHGAAAGCSLYFSMASKTEFSRVISGVSDSTSTEDGLISLSLLALSGVESDVFRLGALTPRVSVAGYSMQSMQHFLATMRGFYVVRKLLDTACWAYNTISRDAATLALGSTVTELLHILDTSMARLSEGLLGESSRAASLVELLQRSQPHRAYLWSIFSLICPAQLTSDIAAFSRYYIGESPDVVGKYLCAGAWVGEGSCSGWSLLHSLVGRYSSTLSSVSSALLPGPILQDSLFRNASLLCTSPADGSRICMDFSRSVLAAVAAGHVARPLLLELKSRLYDLDLDSDPTEQLDHRELEEGLGLAIDDIWCTVSGQSGTTGGRGVGPAGACAESCVEFLLCAMAWARGRICIIQLVQFDEEEEKEKERGGRHRRGLKTSVPTRRPLLEAFRGINPTLVLPLSEQHQASLDAVRGRSAAVCADLRRDISERMALWWDEHTPVGPLDAEEREGSSEVVPSEVVPSEVVPSEVVPSEVVPSQAAEAAGEAEADSSEADLQAYIEVADAPLPESAETEGRDQGDVVEYAAGPLQLTRTVDRDLLEAARAALTETYRVKTDSVDRRIAETKWRVQRLKSIQTSRADLLTQLVREGLEAELELRSPLRKSTPLAPMIPQGNSSLSLQHDSGATSTSIHAEGGQSVRVIQQPGGDSSLSLQHDSGATSTSIHAEGGQSVRVIQQPGGDSSLAAGGARGSLTRSAHRPGRGRAGIAR